MVSVNALALGGLVAGLVTVLASPGRVGRVPGQLPPRRRLRSAAESVAPVAPLASMESMVAGRPA